MDAEDTEECQPHSWPNFITDFFNELVGKRHTVSLCGWEN